jgi:hypothetical protein
VSLALAALLSLALGSAAQAKTALAELRVEGPSGALDPGTWYVTGTERTKRSRSSDACERTTGTIKVPGPTAMGLPQTGSETTPGLRQVRIRRDEAGLFVCEIGSVLGRPFSDPDGFAGWSYWQDYAFGSASADQVRLHDGDRILWVYSDFGSTPVNSGPDALELRSVDAGTTDGQLTVKVVGHGFDGSSHAIDDATITGAQSVTNNMDGTYDVTVPNGFTQLRATHPSNSDIPSQPELTCADPNPSACPDHRGRTIVGSPHGDRLAGTRGWDGIEARGGPDVVRLASGGQDVVDCGGGRDLVTGARNDDQIAKNCERVRSR